MGSWTWCTDRWFVIFLAATGYRVHARESQVETVFPKPHRFDSQHWIDDAGRVRSDLRFFTFGFGHQVCPGQHLVNRSIFIITALILFSDTANIHAALFEICFMKRIDENVIRELCAPGK
ncbi:uncharacterized protein HD556DRAFT_1242568 [Suillus plorans]|uniref:Cytochrome P450 n=1 Tax=Suillus plorans TaxID=116603 RepID=A0A9P7AKL9_9AGAM|nr:uncharacterized protein HD556DRAFT_1242568 [Suillus plorans]KAG1790363.1 hypothetical protein HD556DRAFT_1242568 [Suillus plorans]